MNKKPRTYREATVLAIINQIRASISGVSEGHLEAIYRHLMADPKNAVHIDSTHAFLLDSMGNKDILFMLDPNQLLVRCDLIVASSFAMEVRGAVQNGASSGGSGCTSCGGSSNNNNNNNNNNNG